MARHILAADAAALRDNLDTVGIWRTQHRNPGLYLTTILPRRGAVR